MKYLSVDEIQIIHSIAVKESGGSLGVRDYGALLSVSESPKQKAFGKELYPNIFLKAAVYAHNIIKFHPFIDGNKRTGMASAVIFLEDNDYQFKAVEREIEKFALKIVNKNLDISAIAVWLEENSKQL